MTLEFKLRFLKYVFSLVGEPLHLQWFEPL